MSKINVSQDAINDQKQFYDERFRQGYMKDFSGLYEGCRLYTIRKILEVMKAEGFNPRTILDYGCGEGRYIGILKEYFPESSIYAGDISEIGLQITKEKYPYVKCVSMDDELLDIENNCFDLIICIEVLEHVHNVKKSIREIERLLRKNGTIIMTTPCANKYSLEWFFNKFTSGLQTSFDGYMRFSTDEPAHLRRLVDSDIIDLFANVDILKIYHRAHFFTTIMAPMKILPNNLRIWIGLLDWHLFKNLPNGATMMVMGKKMNG